MRSRWVIASLVLALAACSDTSTPGAGPSAAGPSLPGPSAGLPAPGPSASGPSASGPPASVPPVDASPEPPVTSSPAPAPSRTTARPPAAEDVRLVRSGGFTGDTETIEVGPDGAWERGGSRAAAGRTGRLSTAQRTQLQRLIADPALTGEASRRVATRGTCNDTYIYVLAVPRRTIRWEPCPGAGDPPRITKQIIDLLLSATH